MPKLILFAPCEKIVIDGVDNTTSLISLLEGIHVAIPFGQKAEIPGTPIPVSWYVLALWQTELSDEGKRFESNISMRLGNEEITLSSGGIPVAFEPNKPNFRNVVRIVGLPLDPLLEIDAFTVTVSIREVGAREWTLAGSFPVLVRRPESAKST